MKGPARIDVADCWHCSSPRGVVVQLERPGSPFPLFQYVCAWCGARGPSMGTVWVAIAAWNTHAEPHPFSGESLFIRERSEALGLAPLKWWPLYPIEARA